MEKVEIRDVRWHNSNETLAVHLKVISWYPQDQVLGKHLINIKMYVCTQNCIWTLVITFFVIFKSGNNANRHNLMNKHMYNICPMKHSAMKMSISNTIMEITLKNIMTT